MELRWDILTGFAVKGKQKYLQNLDSQGLASCWTGSMFLIRRAWCNYICPVGSFLGIFRFKKTMKVVYSEDAEHLCGKCLECVKACQLGLNPIEGKIYPLCYNCGDCIVVCEEIKGKGKPLSFRFWESMTSLKIYIKLTILLSQVYMIAC